MGDIQEIFAHYPSADWAPLAVVAVEKLDGAGNTEFFKTAVQSRSPAVVARSLEAMARIGKSASCFTREYLSSWTAATILSQRA